VHGQVGENYSSLLLSLGQFVEGVYK